MSAPLYTCRTCRFFHSDDEPDCRRYAPRAQMAARIPCPGDGDNPWKAEWPTVDPETDWCGEHERRGE